MEAPIMTSVQPSLMEIATQLHKAAQVLAALNRDLASERNGVGFNKPDSSFGFRISEIPPEEWEPVLPEMVFTAYTMLKKYSRQLAAYGINYKDIPVPPTPQKDTFVIRAQARQAARYKSAPRLLRIDEKSQLSVKWGISEQILTEFKELLAWQERKWDKENRTGWWLYPSSAGSVDKIIEFCGKWRIEITDEALMRLYFVRNQYEKGVIEEVVHTPSDTRPKLGRFMVPMPQSRSVKLMFDYDIPLKDAIALTLPVRKFVPKDEGGPYWTASVADAGCIDAVLALAEAFDFEFRDGAKEYIESLRGAALETIEASKAMHTDFRVPGLLREPYPFQYAGVEYAVKHGNIINGDQMGTGKAQPLDAKVLTPTGWKCMGDVVVGDTVIGADGCPTKVIGVFPQGEKEIYKVVFSDGSFTECCDDHLWSVNKAERKWRGAPNQVLALSEIRTKLKDAAGNARHYIPMVSPVHFEDKPVEIDAYLLGLLIGDGSVKHNTPMLTTADKEVVENILEILPSGVTPKFNGKYGYSLSGKRPHPNPLTIALRKLKLMGKMSYDKFIPDEYKYNSVEIRISMLQGLMDTDGSVSKNHLEFSSSSKKLAEDVQEIVESLGGTSKITIRQTSFTHKNEKRLGAISYRVHISLPNGIVPFRLKRKVEGYKEPTKYNPTRAIVSVEYVGKKEAQCISVSSERQLYVTDRYIVTHNTVQSIVTAFYLKAFPLLVLCPATLKYNWRREVESTIPDVTISVFEKSADWSSDVVIINYDMVSKDEIKQKILARKWGMLVCDEAHMLKNSKAQRTKAVMEIKEVCERVMLLTGTPIMNRPEELISLLKIIGKLQSHFGGYSKFIWRYCSPSNKVIRGKKVVVLDGASNLDELHRTLRNGCMIRRLKQDVLTELPAKTRSVIPVKIDNRKEYDKAEEDIVHYVAEIAAKDKAFLESIKDLPEEEQEAQKRAFANDKAQRAARAEILVKINHLRQIAAKGKLSTIKAWVEDFMESGEKLLLFGYYKSVVETFGAAFNADIIYGETELKARDKAVQKFQNDSETKILVLNMMSGGVGLTLTAASNVAFAELGWRPGDLQQAEDRVHRISQNYPCTAWYFLDFDTIDSYLWNMVLSKQNVADQALDGGEVNNFEVAEKAEVSGALGFANELLKKHKLNGEVMVI